MRRFTIGNEQSRFRTRNNWKSFAVSGHPPNMELCFKHTRGYDIMLDFETFLIFKRVITLGPD